MLTSLQNQKVKEWKKLHKRKHRNLNRCFLVEGHHLVEEVIKSNWGIQEFIIQEGVEFPLPDGIPTTEVSRQVFAAISETETPQGIAAVVEQKQFTFTPAPLTLMIDAVQDPGNLGTLIRTADAAGFDQIILGEGTVDPYNDKVIRATQGSLFHTPFVQEDLAAFISELKNEGVEVWASTLDESVPFKQLDPPEKVALIVGNEGHGIQEKLTALADRRVHIPIYGQAESLNVAIAAAVLMYHMKG
ncbi:TrmH family RNA methyltransferase [Halobacillus mangrovi]|uniref:RNA methyltransferase n=1 Tax=Halobacillus mangrovi TaxID=402384 RepID=A0A1W5ZU72_9BACI|nr:RNA methyltransferase [Halobacillus mangrovi]ARI76850.1 RNA methyltransferase [Halobacillus mangrovi]